MRLSSLFVGMSVLTHDSLVREIENGNIKFTPQISMD